jgi:ADP-heptose:LPS heptosyltransferase
VDAFLDSQMISRKRPLVYANPVAKWLTKMWPEDHWAALGDMLVTAAGVALIFGGAPGDAPLIRRIMSKMREPAYCAAGELTVIQSAALLKRSRMYVGVDSGPMHIAAFTGTPVTAIFGPTDPRKIGPYGTGHIVLRNETIDCLVCRKRACRELGCMTGVAPETVFEACVTMLERSSTPAQIKNSW